MPTSSPSLIPHGYGKAADTDGRIVTVEHTSADGPGAVSEMDLRMLMLYGGHELSVEDHAILAASVGLALTEARATGSGQPFIECHTG